MSRPPWLDVDEPEHIPRIRGMFAERLPERLAAVGDEWRAIMEGAWSADGLKGPFRVAHDIAGTAEVLGGARLGQAASALTEAFRPYCPPRGSDQVAPFAPSPAQFEAMAPLVVEFMAAGREYLRWVEQEAAHPSSGLRKRRKNPFRKDP